MTAELDIIHSASLFLELHGDNAFPEARRMAADMRMRGDLEGADIWLKIIVAVDELQRGASRRVS